MTTKYNMSAPVLFGTGTVTQVGGTTASLGCKHVLLLTDEFVYTQPCYKSCKESLEKAGIKVDEYHKCLPEPPDFVVEEVALLAMECGVDGFVAIGGGSVMDTAKGADLLLNNPGPIENLYLINYELLKPTFPLICVPTTAGTGSECTVFSVITDTKNHVKTILFSPAKMAVVDPALSSSAPASITASTGMDVFAHCIEAVTSKMRSAYTEALALEGICRVVKWLPVAVDNGDNMEARENMSAASNLGGIAINNAYTHLGHGIAHVLGVSLHIPHGVACAMAAPEVLIWSAEYLPEKVLRIGKAMGIDFRGDESPKEIGIKTADKTRELMVKIGIPKLSEYCASEEEAVRYAAMVLGDPQLATTPVPIDLKTIKRIIANIYRAKS